MKRALAVIGDVADANTWSGIPHFFFQEARRQGFLQMALNLDPKPLRWRRGLWHVSNLLRGRRPRGFQYTPFFRESMYSQFERQLDGNGICEVLSHSQVFPVREAAQKAGIRYSYYTDTPLRALFESHGMLEWLEPGTAAEIMEKEAELYQGAERIVGMAKWVAEYLAREYRLPAAKLHTVLPGANLPEDAVARLLEGRGPRQAVDRYGPGRPFRLGFTGKDWRRKGLLRLIEAAESLRARGYCVELLAIGFVPRRLQRHPLVRWVGFVDKKHECGRFLKTIDQFDLGCFPSYQEPMGIAPLECLRVGIPVLCTAVGGLVDACPEAEGAGILVSANASGEEIADRIEPLILDPGRLQAMNEAAWRIREHYSWARTVRDMKRIWGEA